MNELKTYQPSRMHVTASTAGSTTCAVSLNTLPDEIFEQIIRYAVDFNDGQVPLHSWYLTAVNQRFHHVIHNLVTRVVLTSTASTASHTMPTTHFVKRILPRCRRLRHLSLESCHSLDDRTIGTFLRCGVKLKSFSVSICRKQTWRLLEDMCLHAKPSALILYGCNRDRHEYEGHVSSTHRRRATFHPCAVLHDQVMSHIVKHIPLKHIALNHALSLTDESLYCLATCHTLSSITLQRLTSITDLGIIRLVDGRSKLKNLFLQSCSMLTDESLKAIATGRSTKRLQTLKLTQLARITSVGLKQIIRSCKSLSSIRIDRCSSITNFEWTKQADGEQGVQKLNELLCRGSLVTLSDCEEALCLSRLGGNFLRTLDLSFTSGLNSSNISVIRLSAPLLSRIAFQASSHIDDSCMFQLSQFQNLTHLDISHCAAVSADAICEFLSSCASKPTPMQYLVIGPQSIDGPLYHKSILLNILRACRVTPTAARPSADSRTAYTLIVPSGSSTSTGLNVYKLKLCAKVDEQYLKWMKRNCKAAVEVSHLLPTSQKLCHSASSSSGTTTMTDITNSNSSPS